MPCFLSPTGLLAVVPAINRWALIGRPFGTCGHVQTRGFVVQKRGITNAGNSFSKLRKRIFQTVSKMSMSALSARKFDSSRAGILPNTLIFQHLRWHPGCVLPQDDRVSIAPSTR